MKSVLPAMFAAAAMTMAVSAASAQSYPRVTGTGENVMVDYGPMPGNILGGGRVVATRMGAMGDVDLLHLDGMFSQSAREGFVPLTIGTGEGAETVWVPAAMVAMMRQARQNMQRR